MVKKQWLIALALVCVVSLSAGCGSEPRNAGSSNAPGEANLNTEPVTLQVFQSSSALTDEEFENYFIQPVSKKYPNITLNLVRSGKGTLLSDLVASKTPLDLIYTSQVALHDVFELNLHYNLNDLVKKNKFDVDRFEPVTLDGIKLFSQNNELYGLPFSYNSSALFYNKDLFNKFGKPYPKDKMTWDEVIELGKSMAREDGGVQYKALYPSELWQVAQQLSAPYSDPKSDVPLLNTEPWRKAATLYKKIYDIPGNKGAALADFFVARVAAMYAGPAVYTIGQVQQALAEGKPLNWDMVSYPNLPETKGKSMELAVQILAIPSSSQHKDQAFQVMSLITGQENQLNISRQGRISALKDQTVKVQFGAASPALQGKNLQAFFLNTPPVPVYETYLTQLKAITVKGTPNLLDGGQDINTFQQSLNELAQKAINEEKAGNGGK